MSLISGVGAGLGLFQFLGQLAAKATQQTAGTSATGNAASTGSTGSSQGVQGQHRHHHRGGGENGLFQQISTAVTSALQSAQSSGSTSDPNQVIQQAIAQVLAGGQNTSTTGQTPATTTAAIGTAGGDPRQAFFQTLQSLGVTPEQFRSDFLAALKQVMGSQAGTAAAPTTGVTLDTAA